MIINATLTWNIIHGYIILKTTIVIVVVIVIIQ